MQKCFNYGQNPPSIQKLFIGSALREVCQVLNTQRQLPSHIYMQKIHNHTYKTRQAEISIQQDLKSPTTGFLIAILVKLGRKKVSQHLLFHFYQKYEVFHSMSIYLRPLAFLHKTNSKQG